MMTSPKFPERSVIFPLPNTVLFPNTILPLIIYEPHYRLMLEDCLKSDNMMAVVLMRKGGVKSLLDAPTYPVAGLGRITRVSKLPDLSFNVFLGGIARISITRYIQHRPYPIAEIEKLDTQIINPERVSNQFQKAFELFHALVKNSGMEDNNFLARLEEIKDPDITSNLIAASLDIDAHTKQQLLEILDLSERLDKLTHIIERQIEQRALLQEILAGAPRNIHDN